MKVKMLRNPARDLGCTLLEGQVGEVEQKIGEKLVKLGIAVETHEAETDAETIRAVPARPTIAEAKPAVKAEVTPATFENNPHAPEAAAAEPQPREGSVEHAEARLKEFKDKASHKNK